MITMEIVGLAIGLVLTLMIFSYILGDNILYRLALALLVGSGVGYALGMAWRLVLWPWIQRGVAAGSPAFWLSFVVPLVLGILLLLKAVPPRQGLAGELLLVSNVPLALLIGVGAALAVSGAVVGALIPQVQAAGEAMSLERGAWGVADGVLMVVGTIATLAVFQARVRTARNAGVSLSPFARLSQRIGGAFIAVTLGVAFGGAIISGLTALVTRLEGLYDLLQRLSLLGG